MRFNTHACKRLSAQWLIITMVSAASPACLTAEVNPPFKVGSEIAYPPFCIVDDLGRADGFAIELMTAVLQAMDRPVEFRTGEWPSVINWLARGEVEALPLVGRTPERESMFDFTFPYMTVHGAIIVRHDTTGIENIEDLRGRRVAVMKADNAEEFLRREDRGIEIATTTTFAEALRELSEGRHDAVVMQRLVALRLIREARLTNLRVASRPIEDFRQDFCFAVRKGDASALALLNEGLSLVIADGTFRRLHTKWFGELDLTSGRRIVSGGDHHYPPYEFLDSNGKPDGFAVELIQAIARHMDLNVEVRLGPWAQMVQSLETGGIDAIQGMFYSPRRSLVYDFSVPHSLQHYVCVVRAGTVRAPESFAELEGMKLAAQEGDLINELLAAHGLDAAVLAVETQADVLRAVADGRAECGLVMRLSAMDLIRNLRLRNLRLGRRPVFEAEYCIAVSKGNDALLAAFNEGIQLLKESGEYRRIHDKWFGRMDASNVFQTALRTALWVLGPMLSILLVILLWSWSLRSQVARRTHDLRESESRFRHLNRVLRAVRDITQLIVREQNVDSLISHACGIMVKYRGYASALIMLTDGDNHVRQWTGAGKAMQSERLRELINSGGVPSCCRQAGYDDKAVTVSTLSGEYGQLALTGECANSVAMCMRLAHGGVMFGFIMVEMESEMEAVNEDERLLFSEIAGDLAYALHGIQSEKAHVETEQQREQLTEQLAQAQKMEAVGRLAGGVAHDFNNLLMGIMGYTEICREQIEHGHPAREFLDEIMAGAKRSADLTRQLLAFARKQTVMPEVMDLNDAISNMLKLLHRLLGEDIHLAWMPCLDVWPVKMDPSQIDQILANLCVNARDAINGVGALKIETENVVIDGPYCRRHPDAVPGDFVMLKVSDSGAGMSPDVLEHLFEPFFTTKESGKGTGLGLATVYGIVRQNNGFINVRSEVGRGTTFEIHLPRTAPATVADLSGARQALAELPRGSETILLAEDDASIRIVTERLLKALGYTLLVADGPRMALRVVEEHTGPIHLLLTDVVMPEMSGRDLAAALQQRIPALKTLYMSGYTADVIVHHGVLEEGIEFLPKPVSRTALAEKIRDLLDAS